MSGYLKKSLKIAVGLFLFLILLGAAAAGYGYYRLRQSLPVLEGEVAAPFLQAPARIERDALGTVTITGGSRLDTTAALGFCHAQERYFGMDLLRRKAAGELSGLVGPAAFPEDRKVRIHRFRSRARQRMESLSAEERDLLGAYTRGVNAGLSALDSYPFEYLLLGREPSPWREEDTLLVVYTMYLDLQGDYPVLESAQGVMHDLLPGPLYEFLCPPGTEWDAPVEGEAFTTPAIPGSEVFSLRENQDPQPETEEGQSAGRRSPAWPPLQRFIEVFPAGFTGLQPSGYQMLHAGSNNWAVSGEYTAHGRPIVADDMHLGLMVPNIWFRASLAVSGPAGEEEKVTGVSLPGTPLIIAGSNGRIAWGFTNSQGDWLDLVVLEPGPEEGTYLTPEGPLPFTRIEERIVAGDGSEETLEIEETIWGPVVDTDHQGRKRAARWVAYDPEGINMGLSLLSRASTVEEALEIAASCGLPAQNLTVADREGNIGWTIIGPIPRRTGYSGLFPASWASGECRWDGFLDPGEYPRIINPPGGRIWTANARVVSGEKLEKVGFGGYALGPRARQIRDDLLALGRASEKDLLGVQLDYRAVFLSRWRDLILEEVLKPAKIEGNLRLREVRELVEDWGGKASPDSAGYRYVRQFRNILAQRVFDAITARCLEADPRFNYYQIRRDDGPLWKLVREQPLHLLPAEFADWDALMLDAMEQLVREAEDSPEVRSGAGLAGWTWGARNTAAIRHPLSPFLPVSFLARFLDAPPDLLPGDSRMPRAQGPAFGASERMVVSPGLEEQGIFHMPGGQSGHPLSPFYLSGHQDWVQGNPTPFLPGEPVCELVLRP